MAILVVFQNGRHRKCNIFYKTLLIIDLYKQTWYPNIHFDVPKIQWLCFQVDRIFTMVSSGLFDYLFKLAADENG